MGIFKNFIFVFILIGFLTRVGSYLFSKKFGYDLSMTLSFVLVAMICLPIASITIGFDVAVSEYLVSLAIWLIFDLVKKAINPKLKK